MNNHHQPILDPHDPAVLDTIDTLARMTGVDPDTLSGRQITDMLHTTLKLMPDGRHAGELKLLCASLKELRYAYNVFSNYSGIRKIAIFGSARTPPDHPDYKSAVEFARLMANNHQWMVITGAGDGIMKAGHEGPGREASFGVSIRLPFETTANTIIAGDDKLINFRYFFTRKLIFVSQSDAVVLFPGGFGTQDENFEALTLIQTGKSHLVPVVMLSGGEHGARSKGGYWQAWLEFVERNCKETGWICESDMNLFHLAESAEEAAKHILKFYSNFHSYRYVAEQLVIRMHNAPSEAQLKQLNDDFADLVASGQIESCEPFDVEDDALDLPRIRFHHTRRDWGRMRLLIDRLNEW